MENESLICKRLSVWGDRPRLVWCFFSYSISGIYCNDERFSCANVFKICNKSVGLQTCYFCVVDFLCMNEYINSNELFAFQNSNKYILVGWNFKIPRRTATNKYTIKIERTNLQHYGIRNSTLIRRIFFFIFRFI